MRPHASPSGDSTSEWTPVPFKSALIGAAPLLPVSLAPFSASLLDSAAPGDEGAGAEWSALTKGAGVVASSMASSSSSCIEGCDSAFAPAASLESPVCAGEGGCVCVAAASLPAPSDECCCCAWMASRAATILALATAAAAASAEPVATRALATNASSGASLSGPSFAASSPTRRGMRKEGTTTWPLLTPSATPAAATHTSNPPASAALGAGPPRCMPKVPPWTACVAFACARRAGIASGGTRSVSPAST